MKTRHPGTPGCCGEMCVARACFEDCSRTCTGGLRRFPFPRRLVQGFSCGLKCDSDAVFQFDIFLFNKHHSLLTCCSKTATGHRLGSMLAYFVVLVMESQIPVVISCCSPRFILFVPSRFLNFTYRNGWECEKTTQSLRD